MISNTFMPLVVCIRSTSGTACTSNETADKLIFIFEVWPIFPRYYQGECQFLSFLPANLFSRLVEKKITVISQVFNQVFHLVLWCNFKTSKRNSINLLATRWRLISHCKTSNYMYTLNCYNHRLIARLLARRTTFARGCNVSVSKSNFMLTGHLYCTLRLRELTRKTHSTNLLASALEFGLVRAPRRNKTDTLPRVFCPVFAPCHMYVLVCMCTQC